MLLTCICILAVDFPVRSVFRLMHVSTVSIRFFRAATRRRRPLERA
jgi:hypothetical protein